MRKQILCTALVAFLNLALFINVNAQGPMPGTTQAAECSALQADAGGQMQAMGGMVCETPDPMLMNYDASFTHIEYIITASDSIVTGTAADDSVLMGPAIVGFDDDGIFNPADYGFEDGDEFCVTAVHYNLGNIKAAVDMIFGTSSGINCCSAIESSLEQEVCDPLCMGAGICSGDDVNGFSSVLDLLNVFGAAPLVEGIVDVIENSINTQSGLPCTEEFPICWAVSSNAGVAQSVCYTYNCCGEATGLASTIDTSSDLNVTLEWDSFASAEAYQLAGRKAGKTWKVFPETQNNSRTFTSGLLYDQDYEWSVRVKCDGTWTDWVMPVAVFSTPQAGSKNANTYDIFADVQESLQVELYPNPANTTATLQIATAFDMTKTSYNVQVVDMIGRTISTFTTDATTIDINVSDYADGYYFISVDNGITQTVKKMIIAQ
ncbi:MAG: T9SS type A sorting domain-containing protein [Chitinophagales bacterium]